MLLLRIFYLFIEVVSLLDRPSMDQLSCRVELNILNSSQNFLIFLRSHILLHMERKSVNSWALYVLYSFHLPMLLSILIGLYLRLTS